MDKKNNGKISQEDSILTYIKSRDFASVRELTKYFNLSSERKTRRIIERLRELGEPICISSKGYYYSKDPLEIDKTIQKLLSQAQGQIRTAKNLKLAKQKLEMVN
ncbi:hypothetical protein KQI68_07125 [Peptoniphilus sp. MSJ-1]|uniref:HTH domain n=1 Tax=Peptoniphilus ovalis TaxID=2841503 RepID=A0ABS6FHG4_9FIRM|nr:hypothetical protein [Peptoniphilus ovalis]MBU5669610.1 hypothetical protein [Peptoniphilus ovalis]